MEYLSIKDIAKQFAIPARTVYDKIAKNSSIRIKRAWRSKLIHVADFANITNRPLQSVAKIATNETKNESWIDVAILQKSIATLQSELDTVKDKKTTLERVNNNLETERNRFIQLHSQEKDEKKDWIEKHDLLQKKYHSVSTKFYLFLGMGFILVVLAVIFNIATIQNFFLNLK